MTAYLVTWRLIGPRGLSTHVAPHVIRADDEMGIAYELAAAAKRHLDGEAMYVVVDMSRGCGYLRAHSDGYTLGSCRITPAVECAACCALDCTSVGGAAVCDGDPDLARRVRQLATIPAITIRTGGHHA